MKQSFEIYPALFRITPRSKNSIPGINLNNICNENNQCKETDNGSELSHPHVHYGSCVVNVAHTLVTLNFGNVIGNTSEFELPDSLLGRLKSETFKGKHYIISYVPVLN